MVTAHLLITTKSNAEKEVVEVLQASELVQDVNIVYGEYDIVARIDIEDIRALNDFLLNVVRPIKGIEKSSTLIAAF